MDSMRTDMVETSEFETDLEELEIQDTALDANEWEWGLPMVIELPCGIHTSDMIFNDAPVIKMIGQRNGQPLTRRICYCSRTIVPTGMDVEEDIEVLFTFFDATVSLECEESGAIRQRFYMALRTLNILPAPDEMWEMSTECFKSNAKFFNRIYRGILAKDAEKVEVALELMTFAFPYESERFDNFKTWGEAVDELKRTTGFPLEREVYKLYNTEKEIGKFKGFSLNENKTTIN